MNGAREFAQLFQTGQHGRLYLVSSSHGRGKTFHVYVLPEGVEAKPNHNCAPLNVDAVEVYGITGGQPGWTETYGWLHKGRWQDDFAKLVAERRAQIADREAKQERDRVAAEAARIARQRELLASY
ncbi:hypothetical protein AB4097_07875 [Microvirga sp. 2MCAF35]|uniref:hypothetical protein n=1 Tax=Microvirga sp. 2MCAF35 TaxID=3232987 RepID=UPI003F962C7F